MVEEPCISCPAHRASLPDRLVRDRRGAMLVEAAIGLTLLIVVLIGIASYGLWFMAAHSLQQVANEAARATLGSLDGAERDQRAGETIAASTAQTGVLDEGLLSWESETEGRHYTVRLSYAVGDYPLFSTTLVPLPADTIRRSATIEVTSL